MSSRAFDPVDLSVAATTQPYFVYNRLALAAARVYDLFSIPYGFDFLLRRVVTRWDGQVPGAVNAYTLPVELYNEASARARQNVAVPLPLLSTPGGDTVAGALAGAPLGISFVVLPRHSAKIVNLAFPFGDTLKLITVTDFPAAAPGFIDIVLEGYLIPEQVIALWGKKSGGSHGDN